MYSIIKPLLFSLEPEKAHHITVRQLQLISAIPGIPPLLRSVWGHHDESLRVRRMGLDFENPVGLAAGFDKNGSYVDCMSNLGFGFIEVGTVTPRPQAGNETPRLFRLPKDSALINRMGFNNDGIDRLVESLRKLKRSNLVIGGNIGKNKVTSNDDAVQDYMICFSQLFDFVDYFVVNVSSPNTPGLRELQEKKPLTEILKALQDYNQNQPRPKPLLLKISPDLTKTQLDDVLSVVDDQNLDGLIATNTTLNREALTTSANILDTIGSGGLSGVPLHASACASIRHIRQHTPSEFTIIGVGGIDSPDAAIRMLDDGADLIQLYTGLIYNGPGLVGKINKAVAKRNRRFN